MYISVHVPVCVYVCRHVYVYEYDFYVCPYVYILRLHVLYDYVQHCEDTVSVELPYMNKIYYYCCCCYYYHHYHASGLWAGPLCLWPSKSTQNARSTFNQLIKAVKSDRFLPVSADYQMRTLIHRSCCSSNVIQNVMPAEIGLSGAYFVRLLSYTDWTKV